MRRISELRNCESACLARRHVYPTDPFTSVELQNQESDEFYVIQERHCNGFGSSKLVKGAVGYGEIADFYVVSTSLKKKYVFGEHAIFRNVRSGNVVQSVYKQKK